MKNWKIILCFSLMVGLTRGQELQSYISEAVVNNPEIQAFELRHSIAEEKIEEANTLPNTNFSLGYFVSEPETRTGAQRARFSVSQMLPWFGTITARENYASSMAETEFVELAIAKRKLALSVAQTYYQLYAISEKQEILEQNIQLLQTYERMALTSIEVDKASAVDVLRLQIRQNELKQQLEVLQQEYLSAVVSFENLLYRKENTGLEIVSELTIPINDTIYGEEDLALNPELLKYEKLYESVVQSELLNQKERAPNVGFGLDFIPVSERTDMNMIDNGKDILMPMVSISIPIFNNRYSSISRQNELKQKEIEHLKAQRLRTLETALAHAVSQRNQARISFNTQTKNLEQARDAEEILMKNYETGTIDFTELLEIQELQIKFNLNIIDAIVNYYKQSAIINYLINK